MIQGWLKKLQGRRDQIASPAPADAPQQAAERLRQGNAALAAGQLAEAAQHYRAVIALAPRESSGHTNLGYVLLEQGDAAGALASLEEAVSLGGGPDAHYMSGQAHAALGRWDDARRSYGEAVATRPDFGFAWRELGAACEHLGDAASALQAYERATQHAPELTDALGACARMQLQLARYEEALATARRWTQAAPQEWAAVFVEAQALSALGRKPAALDALDRAAALAPGNAAIHYTRAGVLFGLARFDEADRAYDEALQAAPDWVDARVNRGVVLDRLGRHEEALACFDRVLADAPGHKLALHYKPMVLVSLGRVPQALESVGQARAQHPEDADIEWHYAFTHLLAGRMQEGWPAYEARWRAVEGAGVALVRRAFPQALWTGQPLTGKTLLLHPEQGLGDILQFIRFAPVLEEMGARVLVWAPDALKGLLATLSDRVTVASRLEDLPPADYQCPLMSVAGVLGTTLETLPRRVPYLHADARRRTQWAARLGPSQGLRVGVVWSGNAAQRNDVNRSMPLATFARIDVPGCEFVALQNAVRDEDRAAMRAWPQLRFFGEEMKTFADTAALAAEMDLVVSVCTSGAHLAGALGLPLWVLLSYRADWRWLLDRDDSPWYPSARLFRQDASRKWEPVIERVRQQLIERRDAALKAPAST